MRWYLVAQGVKIVVRFRGIHQGHCTIHLIALARLDEEELRLTSQSDTPIRHKGTPDTVQLVSDVLGVDVAELTVGKDGNEDAVVLTVVEGRILFNLAVYLLQFIVLEDLHVEAQVPQCGCQFIRVLIRPCSVFQALAVEELMIEN